MIDPAIGSNFIPQKDVTSAYMYKEDFVIDNSEETVKENTEKVLSAFPFGETAGEKKTINALEFQPANIGVG
uniref:Uncharacterized protein n=1 Tax=Romanomermis culicivorax TaxID=13658 RepID=A0A915J1N0_ROMCU